MCKTDITKSNLYIKKIINVIKARNQNHQKLLYVDGRHSDAFVYIISGSCSYTFNDGRKFTASEGDILYLAHKAVYEMYIHTKNYEFIFCDFEFDSDVARKSDVYFPKNSSDTENLFNKLLKCYTTPASSSLPESLSMLYRILGVVFKTVCSASGEKNTTNRISELKEYIDVNFKDTSLSVSFLAEMAGISEVYFRKLFKSQYDISPSQYILSVRLEKAKEFMKYPFLSLEECALLSGFSSLQYFCRIFKAATGTTPAKFRKER